MSCHSFVQNHILAVITGVGYSAKLPAASEEAWDSILADGSTSEAERRRLEWVGDSVMRGRTSLKVYEMFPQGNVDLYTTVRSFVLSNATFRQLMQKIGAVGVGVSSPTSFPAGKIPADIFEMVVGAFYNEKRETGYEHEFDEWFDDTFMPLIEAAEAAFRGYKQSDSC
ncbi:hypothetical protein FB451DRAFT_73989 [Mycena latifolia]|nr:hypothetical protein FB451DRAFT_73989 [Mycena latifolia]